MSNQHLTPFTFENHPVRVVTGPDGESWFVLLDVCEALGLTNPSSVAQRLRENQRSKLSLGRQGNAIIISETGLYRVVLRSDSPKAEPFQCWVEDDVLPSIRRDGGYISPDATQEQLKRLEIRARGKQIRNAFTNTLQAHGVHGAGYALCTDAINTPILGAPAALAKKQRSLPVRANLRDHLSSEELSAITLAEEASKRRIEVKDVRGNHPCSNECSIVAQAIAEAIA